MEQIHPRIRTALISINPTSEHPAHHGVPTALSVLRGVETQIAVWRPYPGANNIREIALHIAWHENAVANRLWGKTEPVEFKQRKTGWAFMLDEIDEAQWKNELALIKRVHERLAEGLAHFDPTLLDQPVGKATKHPIIVMIHGVAEHTLYHTAQMEMLKTLAGKIK